MSLVWKDVHLLLEAEDGGSRLATYLVRKPGGNVLVYPAGYSDPAAVEAEALGGVSDILLDHRDLLFYEEPWRWKARFGARLHFHASDARLAAGRGVDSLFGSDFDIRPGFTVLHAPGHTPSSCAALLDCDGGLLFTSDFLSFEDPARPRFVVKRGAGSAADAATTLGKLAALRFEAVAPVIVPPGGPVIRLDAASRARVFDELRASLNCPPDRRPGRVGRVCSPC